MHRTTSITLVALSLVAVPVAAVAAVEVDTAPIFRCTVEDARNILSTTPLTSKPIVGPASVYSEFEFDTASGRLRWVTTDGTLGAVEHYRITQKGNGAYDWVAVRLPVFAGDRLQSQLNSVVTSFIRIRPWTLEGFEDERGRFFMITNQTDLVVGHCSPR